MTQKFFLEPGCQKYRGGNLAPPWSFSNPFGPFIGLCIRQSHDIFFYLCFYLHLFNVIKLFFFDSWGFR